MVPDRMRGSDYLGHLLSRKILGRTRPGSRILNATLINRSVFMTMCFITILFLVPHLFCPVSHAEEDRWTVIHEDESGNTTYVEREVLGSGASGTVLVIMKYIGNKGRTVMYFQNEIDCPCNRIKRLSMSLHNPSCLGEGEAVYNKSFEGRWDAVSEGLEKKLRDVICIDVKEAR